MVNQVFQIYRENLQSSWVQMYYVRSIFIKWRPNHSDIWFLRYFSWIFSSLVWSNIKLITISGCKHSINIFLMILLELYQHDIATSITRDNFHWCYHSVTSKHIQLKWLIIKKPWPRRNNFITSRLIFYDIQNSIWRRYLFRA